MPGSVAKAPLKVSEFYAPRSQSSAWQAYNQSFHATLFPAVGAYPTTGLVSYWTLDEASGTRFDSCGSNDLTDNNTVTSATGIQGNDAFFTAANSQYLSCASNPSLQVTGDFTIACWVKLTTNPSSGTLTYQIVAKDSDVTASRDYTLDYSVAAAPNGFRFYQNYNGLSTSVAYSGGSPISTGVWTHVVAIYDSASGFCSLRINDTTTFTAVSANTAMVQSAAEFRIGARVYAGNNDFMDGEIDEVGFWKRKLTSTEITSLYHGGAGVTYSVATLTRKPLKSLSATLFQSGAALATDNFNRANSPLGANWGSVTGLADFTVTSNQADCIASGTNYGDRYTAVAAPADQYSKVTVTTLKASTSVGIGPAVRMASGAVTMYLLQGNTTETTMFKAVAGSFTQLGSSAAASAVNDVLEIDAVGSSITAKKNGVVIIGPITDSAIASGDWGIWASNSTAGVLDLDNWEGGVPGGGPLATLTRNPFKSLTATFSPIAALTKKYLDAGFTATLSFIGNLAVSKTFIRALTATLSFTGNLAVSKTFVRAFTATLNFAGALSRRTGKVLTATLAPTATLVKRIVGSGFTATLSFAGAITKNIRKNYSAITSFVGNLAASKLFVRAFSATLLFTGALSRQIGKALSATLSFIGNLATNLIHGGGTLFTQNLTASLSFVGNISTVRGYFRSFTATLFPPAVTFNPATIAGLKVWYKADALALNDGDPVATWFDSSGTGYNVTATGAQQPTFKTNVVNGQPIVRFDGISNRLFNAASTAIVQPDTIFTVINATTPAGSANNVLCQLSGLSGGQQIGYNSNGFFQLYAGGSILLDAKDSTRAFHCLTGVIPSGGGGNGYLDGVLRLTGLAGTGTVGSVSIMSNVNGTILSKGDIAEFLIYNSALSDTDRGNVEGYLKNKYAIGGPVLAKRTTRKPAASLSFIGNLVAGRFFTRLFTATLSFAGNLATATHHFFLQSYTATLSFVATIASSRRFARALSATLNMTGAIRRQTGKSLAATLSFSAALRKMIRKGFSATLSFIGFLFRGGAVEIIAGVITGALVRMGLAGSSARIGQAGSQLDIRETTSEADIPTTGSSLRVERTK